MVRFGPFSRLSDLPWFIPRSVRLFSALCVFDSFSIFCSFSLTCQLDFLLSVKRDRLGEQFGLSSGNKLLELEPLTVLEALRHQLLDVRHVLFPEARLCVFWVYDLVDVFMSW